jgi:hypothetical protein
MSKGSSPILIAWIGSTTVLSPTCVFAAEPVDSAALIEARAFLDEYQTASAAHSASFYDLYSDRAAIHTRVQGKDEGIAFQGRAYKAWGRSLIESRRAVPDASEFHDATVEERGARLVVRAKRYSTLRCYWDLHYVVALEKEGTSYRIVEERLTTNPEGVCRDSGTVAARTFEPVTAPPAVAGGSFPAPGPPPWRPLSEDQMTSSASQLAWEAVSRYPEAARTSPPEVSAGPIAAAGVRVAEPSDLWVSPEGSP